MFIRPPSVDIVNGVPVVRLPLDVRRPEVRSAKQSVRVRETTSSQSTQSQEAERSIAVTPSLGVSCKSITPELASYANLPVSEGAYVCSVLPDSGAALAGIVTGDAIVAIDDTAVRCARDLVMAVREHSLGDDIIVTLIRDSSGTAVVATLSVERAEQEPAESSEPSPLERQIERET